MPRCGAEHPEDAKRTCILFGTGHADHMDLTGHWQDPQVLAASAERRANSKRGRRSRQTQARHDLAGLVQKVIEGKAEGMARAATSETSRPFRTTFFLAMAELATTSEFVSTNTTWELLEARGYQRKGHANAAGTVGPSGVKLGLWEVVSREKNTSGNYHSTDDVVNVYRSKIRGQLFADIASIIEQHEAQRAASDASDPVDSTPVTPTSNLWGPRDSSNS